MSGSGTALTYRMLFARALDLSGRLRAAGVRHGDLVGLCVPRSPELVVGALGILLTGGGYVALDPDQPDERLRFMLADCTASVLVAHGDIGQRARWPSRVVPPHAGENGAMPRGFIDPHPDAPAYAVYTSGSTGRPKGVLVGHAGLLNLIAWHQGTFGLTAADRTTLIANPGFDASVWEIWPALTAGASLHIPPADTKTDPVRLRDWLLAEQITVCFVPTPLAETLTALSWPSSAPLRWLLTGGDVLHHQPPPGLPFTLVNNYGVSEATVVSTSGVVPAAVGEPSTPSMGAAIDGVQLRVIDAQGAVLPPGADGELLICGCSVALGYLGQPELTAQKFVADPLNPAARAYRTGDRVRITAAGSVEFLGRLDDQIQVRGVRVETGELVGAANCHPAVAACAAIAVGDVDGSQLVLFVVPRQDQLLDEDLDKEEVHRFLRRRLPEQMLPSVIIGMPDLPVTANGKIDRAELAALAAELTSTAPGLPGPRNDVEAVLADTVAGLLRRPQVGVDENFFLLGGHSMLGAQLIVRIAELYGIEMSLQALFDHPTVVELAAEVEGLIVAEISGMSDEELLQASASLRAES